MTNVNPALDEIAFALDKKQDYITINSCGMNFQDIRNMWLGKCVSHDDVKGRIVDIYQLDDMNYEARIAWPIVFKFNKECLDKLNSSLVTPTYIKKEVNNDPINISMTIGEEDLA